jgi:hypothetical protein
VEHASLGPRRSKALSAFLTLMCLVAAPSPLVSQEKNTDPANAAAAPPVASSDVITVPDGKPVKTHLTKNLATATAKVGDDLELTVEETVRQDGLVILPKGAVLSAKLTSVRHAGRRSRNSSVSFSVENAVFPGDERTALRPEPPASAGHNLRDGLKAVGQLAVYPEFPPGFGLLLLPVGGPMVLFSKGHEREIYTSETITLYVHGPLSLKREVVLQIQPPPYKGPAQVFYLNRDYGTEGDKHAGFYCGRRTLGRVIANQFLELELNPGAYWLSTGKNQEEKLRLEVEADHQYYVERDAHGLSLKNFDNNPRLLEDGPLRHFTDFTSATPETTEELLATPKPDSTPRNIR